MDSTFSRRTFLALGTVALAAPAAYGEAAPLHHYGMVLDLARCFGCESCTLACRSALPLKGLWRTTIEVKEAGHRLSFTPHLCQQCSNPLCMQACAFEALRKDSDGIARVVTKNCTGCAECVNACPYHAIHIATTEAGEQKAYKCELCCADAKAPTQSTPPCVAACASGARIFGDFLHPHAALASALAKKPQSIPGPAQSRSVLYLLPPGGANANAH